MKMKNFIVITTTGWTELPDKKTGDAREVGNAQVVFIGKARNRKSALNKARKEWPGIDIGGGWELTTYELAPVKEEPEASRSER